MLVVPGSQVDRPRVTVILPAYNEAAIIERNLRRVCDYMTTLEAGYDWDVVVVNDGSTDRTGELADAFARAEPRVQVLHHFSNFNLGQALRYAFNACRGDYVVTLDTDLSYAPEHIGLLLEEIRRTRAKIVIASPYIRGGRTTSVPFVRLQASRQANRLLSFTAKERLATLTSMVRVYDRRFLSTLNLTETGIGINTEIIYKAQLLHAKIVEIPAHLDWTEQRLLAERSSSLRFTRSALAYAFSAFVFRPSLFFVIPGVVALLLSLYTLAWAAYRVGGHLVSEQGPNFSTAVSLAFGDAPHTFVVGGIALLLSVQLLSLGILSVQNKRYFEEVFHLGTTLYRHARPADDVGLRDVQRQPAQDQPRRDHVVAGDRLAQDPAGQNQHEDLRQAHAHVDDADVEAGQGQEEPELGHGEQPERDGEQRPAPAVDVGLVGDLADGGAHERGEQAEHGHQERTRAAR